MLLETSGPKTAPQENAITTYQHHLRIFMGHATTKTTMGHAAGIFFYADSWEQPLTVERNERAFLPIVFDKNRYYTGEKMQFSVETPPTPSPFSTRDGAGGVSKPPLNEPKSKISTGASMNEIVKIAKTLEQFARERDWDQFHTPKNLVMALSVEVAELVEEFQWLTEDQSAHLTPEKLLRVKDEVGDVFNYLVRLSSKLDIDLISAANEKIVKNGSKYPVEKAKGNAKKYTEL